MGRSSARPSDLTRFATRSRRADNELESHARRLRIAYRRTDLEKAFGALHGVGDWHEAFDKLLPVCDELTSAQLMPPGPER